MGLLGGLANIAFNIFNASQSKQQSAAMEKLAKEQGAVAARQRMRQGAEEIGGLELSMAASGIEMDPVEPSGGLNPTGEVGATATKKPTSRTSGTTGTTSAPARSDGRTGLVPKGTGPTPNMPSSTKTTADFGTGLKKKGPGNIAGTRERGAQIKQERRTQRERKAASSSDPDNTPAGLGPKSTAKRQARADREGTLTGSIRNRIDDVLNPQSPNTGTKTAKDRDTRSSGTRGTKNKADADAKRGNRPTGGTQDSSTKDTKNYSRPGRPSTSTSTRAARPARTSSTSSRTSTPKTSKAKTTRSRGTKQTAAQKTRARNKATRKKKRTTKKRARTSRRTSRRSRR